MTIEKAIHELINEYNRVKDKVGIRKPVSFALYNVWKYADNHEKEKKRKGGDIMANSYRYAEESDKARLEGLKVLNELMEKYKELNMQNTGFYTDLERLKETLTVEGD